MKLGLFFEHQLPRPWALGAEQRVFLESLAQIEAADRLGFHAIWLVEHHFLEEYSHCSAPEVILAAASQRTERIRLGHGVRLMPPQFNPPQRVAEMLAMLDVISNGRVEWGTGSCSSRTELEGFDVDNQARHRLWAETTREVARMLSLPVYPGFEGETFRMPPRNILPKPIQTPHPPLWMACSHRDTIRIAAQHGLGALTFAFLTPAEAREWVEEYHRAFRASCVPIGAAPNPQVAMIAGFGCHPEKAEAIARFQEGFLFYEFALRYYYYFGRHYPGASSIHDLFVESGRGRESAAASQRLFDTPAALRRLYREYDEAGVDQLILIQQVGHTRHEHILEANELIARELLPEMIERDEAQHAAKRARIAPHVEAALERKRVQELEQGTETGPPAHYHVDAYGLTQNPALLLGFKKRHLGDRGR